MNDDAYIVSPAFRRAAIVVTALLLATGVVLMLMLALQPALLLVWLICWDMFVFAVQQTLGPPLQRWHAPLDQFLSSLPMWTAQVCAIGLFLLGVIFAWSLPRQFVYLGAPDQARWRDLRIWATAVLVPYMAIYLLLGL